MNRLLRHGLIALLAVCAPLLATTAVEANRPVKQREFSLDPNMGYILVRTGPVSRRGAATNPIFLVRLNPETRTAIWSFGQSFIDRRANLDAAMVYGGNHWGTDGNTSVYIVPVNPGFWVVGGAGATTFSLGSYGFQVNAGEITDIGTVLAGREDGESPIPEIAAVRLSQDLVEFGTLMNIVMSDTMVMRPAAEGQAVPAALSAYTVRRAELVPDVRFDNFMRALVSRAVGLPPLGHQAIDPTDDAAPVTAAGTGPAADPAQAPSPGEPVESEAEETEGAGSPSRG